MPDLEQIGQLESMAIDLSESLAGLAQRLDSDELRTARDHALAATDYIARVFELVSRERSKT